MPESAAKPIDSLPAGLYSSEELLKTILNVSLTGFLFLRPLYGPDNELVDFSLDYLNPAGRRIFGISELSGTLLTRFSHVRVTGVFAFYERVFETGEAGSYSVNYQYDGLDNFFELAAERNGQLLVVSFTDTSNHDRSAVEQALRQSQSREKAARAEVDLQRQQLQNIFMEAPAMICIFTGPNHIFKLVNPPYQQLVGNRPLLGKPIAEAMPELNGQPIFELLDKVYRTGESFHAHEMLVQLDHDNSGRKMAKNYYNFIYQATHNLAGAIDGILVFAYEVTEQVLAHQQVQALNEQLESRVAERTQAVQQAQAEADRQRERLEQFFM